MTQVFLITYTMMTTNLEPKTLSIRIYYYANPNGLLRVSLVQSRPAP